METNTSPSTAQHTPGPWRNGDAGLTVFGPKTSEPAPVTIALLPSPSPRVSHSERKANARLIAAAPELLEVLRDIMDEAEFGDPSLEAKARAAIAKASGRTV